MPGPIRSHNMKHITLDEMTLIKIPEKIFLPVLLVLLLQTLRSSTA